jgi:hypothetical protein
VKKIKKGKIGHLSHWKKGISADKEVKNAC